MEVLAIKYFSVSRHQAQIAINVTTVDQASRNSLYAPVKVASDVLGCVVEITIFEQVSLDFLD